ncbi:MAG: helix-turn-helix transcriptional regulator [Lachnospiraceae bacterium]|nr:helix-turn-helix transcriptional regulator [Lachnospiraceae bacterium]
MTESIILDKIKVLCAENNFSLYKLSKESGVPLSTITSLFSNGSFPSIPTLLKICTAFHITLSDFFLLEETPEYILEEHRILINKYETLNITQKQYLDAYISGLLFH